MTYNLCSTCEYREDCTYRKGRDQVFRCEEFDGGDPPPRRKRREGAPSASEAARGAQPCRVSDA